MKVIIQGNPKLSNQIYKFFTKFTCTDWSFLYSQQYYFIENEKLVTINITDSAKVKDLINKGYKIKTIEQLSHKRTLSLYK